MDIVMGIYDKNNQLMKLVMVRLIHDEKINVCCSLNVIVHVRFLFQIRLDWSLFWPQWTLSEYDVIVTYTNIYVYMLQIK